MLEKDKHLRKKIKTSKLQNNIYTALCARASFVLRVDRDLISKRCGKVQTSSWNSGMMVKDQCECVLQHVEGTWLALLVPSAIRTPQVTMSMITRSAVHGWSTLMQTRSALLLLKNAVTYGGFLMSKKNVHLCRWEKLLRQTQLQEWEYQWDVINIMDEVV